MSDSPTHEQKPPVLRRLRASPASRIAPPLLGLLGLWLFTNSPAPGLGFAVLVLAAATGLAVVLDTSVDARGRRRRHRHESTGA